MFVEEKFFFYFSIALTFLREVRVFRGKEEGGKKGGRRREGGRRKGGRREGKREVERRREVGGRRGWREIVVFERFVCVFVSIFIAFSIFIICKFF